MNAGKIDPKPNPRHLPSFSRVYRASVPAERTKRQLAHDLLEPVFKGSARELVQHALGGREVSTEELAEIRKLVEKLENR